MENQEIFIKQLEKQTELFKSEITEEELINSALSTCSALLVYVEKSLKDRSEDFKLDSIFAKYLGIAHSVNDFNNRFGEALYEKESNILKDILELSMQVINERNLINLKINTEKERNDALQKELDEKNKELEESQNKYNTLINKLNDLITNVDNKENEIKQLNVDLKEKQDKLESFESTISKLSMEMKEANDAYEELVAYYDELSVIEQGVKEEGFIDIASFNQQLAEMNSESENLMKNYDSFLKKLSKDVISLQEKIDKKSKAGAPF